MTVLTCNHICRKILKKHDKMTTTELLPTLMPRIAEMLSKEQRKAALEGLKNNVVHEYGLLAVEGDEERAEQDLSRHQRDQLTFERNTGRHSDIAPWLLISSMLCKHRWG